jgi:hypothetical protein
MKGRLVCSAALAVIAQFMLSGSPAGQAQTTGQNVAAKNQDGAAKKSSKKWTLPRTSWGDPDLTGVYTNSTVVPLERPAEYAGKPELTDAEVAERAKKYHDTLFAQRAGDTGFYNDFWWEWGKDVKRTSLIVDPPDGKLPVKPEAAERMKATKARYSLQESYTDFNPFDRCITRSLPGEMMPGFYNHFYEIVQTPQSVAVYIELIHDVRIIPLDKRPHIDSSVRQWLGDSRGHWEGDTLVVDTTNFNDKVTDNAVTYFGAGSDLHLVERFTRSGPNTIDYQFTVEAPSMFTRPWTASIPLQKSDQKLFEYACHEGNYAMPNSLSGARADEAKTAAGKR